MAPIASEAKARRARAKTSVSSKIDKHLFGYAAAATAAGVGLLGPSAQAKVVYTPVNADLTYNHGVNLDLNNDGIADFTLELTFGPGRRLPEGAFASGLTIYPAQAGNAIVGIVSSKGVDCAAALPAGAKIGSGLGFKAQYLALWEVAGSYTRGDTKYCPWGVQHRGAYVGLKFVINHQVHYGWAHVTTSGLENVLNGFAYETVPNQPIDAGKTSGPVSIADAGVTPIPEQPATLGMLALGANGLSIWRRKEQA